MGKSIAVTAGSATFFDFDFTGYNVVGTAVCQVVGDVNEGTISSALMPSRNRVRVVSGLAQNIYVSLNVFYI